jgi:putative MATE family efflux protein
MVQDMTQGNPVKLILGFTVPMLLGNIFQQFYNMVDAMVVGRFINVNALAAVGSVGSVMYVILGFAMGLTTGFSVIISQKFGAGDEKGVRQATAMSIYLSLVLVILLTVLSVITVNPVLDLMQTPEDIRKDAATYLTIIYAGMIACVFYNLAGSVMRALGDSRTPLIFLAIASVLNVILDLWFVISFQMGVAGVAYATIIAQAVSFFLCLPYIKKHYPILHFRREDWKLDWSLLGSLSKLGLATGLQISVTGIGVVIIQAAVNGMGSVSVAAYTAACKIQNLAVQPSISLGMAIATFNGQNWGARNIKRIKEGVRKCEILAILFAAGESILVLVCGKLLIGLFVEAKETEVISMALQYLKVMLPFIVMLGTLLVYRSAIQGLGNATIPTISGLLETFIRIVVAFSLPSVIGFWAICITDPISWTSAAIFVYIIYRLMMRKIERDPEWNECG